MQTYTLRMLGLRRALINSTALTKSPPLHFSTSPTHAPPSSAYYDELTNLAGRNRDFATVQRLFNRRAKLNCACTNSTFKFLSTDLSILDELLHHLFYIRNGYPRKNAYTYLIAHLSKLHETQKAMRVAGEMAKHEPGATADPFYPILKSTTMRREMEEAWRVVELMKHFKVPPDTESYNYLLSGYCGMGDLASAGGVAEMMRGEGLREDERTYDALVLGACGAGRLDAALLLLRRMVEEGVTPLYHTYGHVIRGMCRDGFYAQAVELVRSFRGRDVKLDEENYGLLGLRLIRFRRFCEAKMVVQEMKRRNIPMEGKLRNFYQYHFVSS